MLSIHGVLCTRMTQYQYSGILEHHSHTASGSEYPPLPEEARSMAPMMRDVLPRYSV